MDSIALIIVSPGLKQMTPISVLMVGSCQLTVAGNENTLFAVYYRKPRTVNRKPSTTSVKAI